MLLKNAEHELSYSLERVSALGEPLWLSDKVVENE
jgi:hypothetical protein